MKRFLILFIFVACAVIASAQQKFDPVKFRAELHQYLITEVGLTPQEQKRFFPLYDEMRDKQRVLFEKQRAIRHQKPTTESACRSAITQKDNLELQIREIERTYHQKFLKTLPATRVYSILAAEERFHKHVFKKLRK